MALFSNELWFHQMLSFKANLKTFCLNYYIFFSNNIFNILNVINKLGKLKPY